jgi:predicted nucleotidyltransferase
MATLNESGRFNWRSAIRQALVNIERAGLSRRTTVILIGSYAHATASAASDVDILILFEGERPKVQSIYGVHLQFEHVDRFRERLHDADDYAIAAVRFGKPLGDALGVWNSFRVEMQRSPWPDWRKKLTQAELRMRLARRLLESGDIDAAGEEYMLAGTQVSRGLLLKQHSYPRSRPELSKQLREIGKDRLASDIDVLVEGASDERVIRSIAQRLEELVREESFTSQ